MRGEGGTLCYKTGREKGRSKWKWLRLAWPWLLLGEIQSSLTPDPPDLSKRGPHWCTSGHSAGWHFLSIYAVTNLWMPASSSPVTGIDPPQPGSGISTIYLRCLRMLVVSWWFLSFNHQFRSSVKKLATALYLMLPLCRMLYLMTFEQLPLLPHSGEGWNTYLYNKSYPLQSPSIYSIIFGSVWPLLRPWT